MGNHNYSDSRSLFTATCWAPLPISPTFRLTEKGRKEREIISPFLCPFPLSMCADKRKQWTGRSKSVWNKSQAEEEMIALWRTRSLVIVYNAFFCIRAPPPSDNYVRVLKNAMHSSKWFNLVFSLSPAKTDRQTGPSCWIPSAHSDNFHLKIVVRVGSNQSCWPRTTNR